MAKKFTILDHESGVEITISSGSKVEVRDRSENLVELADKDYAKVLRFSAKIKKLLDRVTA